MCAAYLGPELADAAGDAKNVIIEFDGRFERDDVFGGCAGKTVQVQLLAADNDVEYATDP
jgi:hypothetical protein